MHEVRPGRLAELLCNMSVRIDRCAVEIAAVPVVGYYEGHPRPTATVRLDGGGETGEGENVDWFPDEHTGFRDHVFESTPVGEVTVGEVAAALLSIPSPYHRSAIEAATIDLALKQAQTNLFEISRRDVSPVSFCWSIGADTLGSRDPDVVIDAILAVEPEARFKIDVPETTWSDALSNRLAGIDRVVVLDFKRRGDAESTRSLAARFPHAWIEDPVLDGLEAPPTEAGRISLDGYVENAADLSPPLTAIGAVNVKPARVGGPLEALRCLERCREEGWHAYIGGMFEVGVGRTQSRVIASLFTPRAWNDLAPLRASVGDPYTESPIELTAETAGFGGP